MAIATGITKSVAYKKETTYGVLAGATGAKYLRRTKSDFNLKKDHYQSAELRTDYQIVDLRHGIRSADGNIDGEFSPGSYSDFFAAALSRDFAVTGATVSANLTFAASGTQYTVTRAAGSFLTDGFHIGEVMRVTSGTGLDASILNKNLLITALTATVATVSVLNSSVLVPGTATACAIATPGKKTYIPLTGHTSNSYTVEEWYSNIAQSEVYTGCKVNTIAVTLPASGMTTVAIGLMGKDLAQTQQTQYFTTPTAQGTTGVTAGVNGIIVFNGNPVALITTATLNIARNITNATVLGSNSIADTFTGVCNVSGSMSLYFTDTTVRDVFNNETEVSLIFSVATGSGAAADFITMTMARCKLNSFNQADNAEGIIASCDFVALMPTTNSTSAEQTTFAIQDSLAV
jgi:Phage tail tube protein